MDARGGTGVRWNAGNTVFGRPLEPRRGLALFPILVLGAHATGGRASCWPRAMVLPSLLVLQNFGRTRADGVHEKHGHTPLPPTCRPDDDARHARPHRGMHGMETACFVLEIDDWAKDRAATRLAKPRRTCVTNATGACASALRGDDLVADLGAGGFGVVLHPVAAARLTIAGRHRGPAARGLSAPLRARGNSLRLKRLVGHAALGGAQAMAAERALAGCDQGAEGCAGRRPGLRPVLRGGIAGAETKSVELSDDVPGRAGRRRHPRVVPAADRRPNGHGRRVRGAGALETSRTWPAAPVRFLGAIELRGAWMPSPRR
jgi:hypothetical protein